MLSVFCTSVMAVTSVSSKKKKRRGGGHSVLLLDKYLRVSINQHKRILDKMSHMIFVGRKLP